MSAPPVLSTWSRVSFKFSVCIAINFTATVGTCLMIVRICSKARVKVQKERKQRGEHSWNVNWRKFQFHILHFFGMLQVFYVVSETNISYKKCWEIQILFAVPVLCLVAVNVLFSSDGSRHGDVPDGMFRKPSEGQSLISYLSEQDFGSCADLEKVRTCVIWSHH